WRGEPLAEISHEHFAQSEIARLEELWAGAIEDRIAADIALGRHADVVSELGALVAAHPLRERHYQLLMIALYRCGRGGAAVAVAPSAGGGREKDLGMDPTRGRNHLERPLLERAPSFELPPRAAPRGGGGERPPSAPRSRRARLLAAAVVCLAVIVALLAGGASVRTQGPAAPVVAGPNTVAVIDTSRNVLTRELTGIGRPGGIA